MSPGPPARVAFDAPWQARLFAIAEQLRRDGHLDWTEFQERVAARAGSGAAPGYDDWLAVLEDLDREEGR